MRNQKLKRLFALLTASTVVFTSGDFSALAEGCTVEFGDSSNASDDSTDDSEDADSGDDEHIHDDGEDVHDDGGGGGQDLTHTEEPTVESESITESTEEPVIESESKVKSTEKPVGSDTTLEQTKEPVVEDDTDNAVDEVESIQEQVDTTQEPVEHEPEKTTEPEPDMELTQEPESTEEPVYNEEHDEVQDENQEQERKRVKITFEDPDGLLGDTDYTFQVSGVDGVVVEVFNKDEDDSDDIAIEGRTDVVDGLWEVGFNTSQYVVVTDNEWTMVDSDYKFEFNNLTDEATDIDVIWDSVVEGMQFDPDEDILWFDAGIVQDVDVIVRFISAEPVEIELQEIVEYAGEGKHIIKSVVPEGIEVPDGFEIPEPVEEDCVLGEDMKCTVCEHQEFEVKLYTQEFVEHEDGTSGYDFVEYKTLTTVDGSWMLQVEAPVIDGGSFLGWFTIDGDEATETVDTDSEFYAGVDFDVEMFANTIYFYDIQWNQNNTYITEATSQRISYTDVNNVIIREYNDISESCRFSGKLMYYQSSEQYVWHTVTVDDFHTIDVNSNVYVYPIYDVEFLVNMWGYIEDDDLSLNLAIVRSYNETREIIGMLNTFYSKDDNGSTVSSNPWVLYLRDFDEPEFSNIDDAEYTGKWYNKDENGSKYSYDSNSLSLNIKYIVTKNEWNFAAECNASGDIILDDNKTLYRNQFATGIYDSSIKCLTITVLNPNTTGYGAAYYYQYMPWYGKISDYSDNKSSDSNNGIDIVFNNVGVIYTGTVRGHVNNLDLNNVSEIQSNALFIRGETNVINVNNLSTVGTYIFGSDTDTYKVYIPSNFFDNITILSGNVLGSRSYKHILFSEDRPNIKFNNIEFRDSFVFPSSLIFGVVEIGDNVNTYKGGVTGSYNKDTFTLSGYAPFLNVEVASVILSGNTELGTLLQGIRIDDWNRCDFDSIIELSDNALCGSNIDKDGFSYFPNLTKIGSYAFAYCVNMSELLYDPITYNYVVNHNSDYDYYTQYYMSGCGKTQYCRAYCRNTDNILNPFYNAFITDLDLTGITVLNDINRSSYSNCNRDVKFIVTNCDALQIIGNYQFYYRTIGDLCFNNVTEVHRSTFEDSTIDSIEFNKLNFMGWKALYDIKLNNDDKVVLINTDDYVIFGNDSMDTYMQDGAVSGGIVINPSNSGLSYVHVPNAKIVKIEITSNYNHVKLEYKLDSAQIVICNLYNGCAMHMPNCDTLIQTMVPAQFVGYTPLFGTMSQNMWNVNNDEQFNNLTTAVGVFRYVTDESGDVNINIPYVKGGLLLTEKRQYNILNMDGMVKWDVDNIDKEIIFGLTYSDFIKRFFNDDILEGLVYGEGMTGTSSWCSYKEWYAVPLRHFKEVKSNTLIDLYDSARRLSGTDAAGRQVYKYRSILNDLQPILENVDMPVLEYCGDCAFYGSWSLKSENINMPNVKRFGKFVFMNGLQDSYNFTNLMEAGEGAFSTVYYNGYSSPLTMFENNINGLLDCVKSFSLYDLIYERYNLNIGFGIVYNLPNLEVVGQSAFAQSKIADYISSSNISVKDKELEYEDAKIIIKEFNASNLKNISKLCFYNTWFDCDISNVFNNVQSIGDYAFMYARTLSDEYIVNDLYMPNCNKIGVNAFQLIPIRSTDNVQSATYLQLFDHPFLELEALTVANDCDMIGDGKSSAKSFQGKLLKRIKVIGGEESLKNFRVLSDFEFKWIEPQSITVDNKAQIFTITSKIYEPSTQYDGHEVKEELTINDFINMYSKYRSVDNGGYSAGYSYEGVSAGIMPNVVSYNKTGTGRCPTLFLSKSGVDSIPIDGYGSTVYSVFSGSFGVEDIMPYTYGSITVSNEGTVNANIYDQNYNDSNVHDKYSIHTVSAVFVDFNNNVRDDVKKSYNTTLSNYYIYEDVLDAFAYKYRHTEGTVYLAYGSYEDGMKVLSCEYDFNIDKLTDMKTSKVEMINKRPLDESNATDTGSASSSMGVTKKIYSGANGNFDLKVTLTFTYDYVEYTGYLLQSESGLLHVASGYTDGICDALLTDITYAPSGYFKYDLTLDDINVTNNAWNTFTGVKHSIVLHDIETDEVIFTDEDVRDDCVNYHGGLCFMNEDNTDWKEDIEVIDTLLVPYDKDVFKVELEPVSPVGNASIIYKGSEEGGKKTTASEYSKFYGTDLNSYTDFNWCLVLYLDKTGEGNFSWNTGGKFNLAKADTQENYNWKPIDYMGGVMPNMALVPEDDKIFNGIGTYTFEWFGKEVDGVENVPLTYTLTFPDKTLTPIIPTGDFPNTVPFAILFLVSSVMIVTSNRRKMRHMNK